MKQRRGAQSPGGFTLIEVIVSLILVAIVGSMVVNFMGTAVTRSADPLLVVQQGHYLNQIMENITADYKALVATDQTPLVTLMGRIGTEGSTATGYGVSGQPYTVVENRRIAFSGTSETTDVNGKVLKVTVSYRGLTLTALFTE